MGFPSATQPNNRAALRWVIDQNQIWCGVREQGGTLYLGLGLSQFQYALIASDGPL